MKLIPYSKLAEIDVIYFDNKRDYQNYCLDNEYVCEPNNFDDFVYDIKDSHIELVIYSKKNNIFRIILRSIIYLSLDIKEDTEEQAELISDFVDTIYKRLK
jgi:hypothetical protein